MPGYYQIMDYARDVVKISVSDENGADVFLKKQNENSWLITKTAHKSLSVHYSLKAERPFVAVSFIDEKHAYFAPANTFLYIDGMLDLPVSVKVNPVPGWNKIVTGLELVADSENEFSAPNFDILYDCPILAGELEELTPFFVNGIEHRFAGYKPGNFDKVTFMENLQKIVEAATQLMGDIPYKNYTFIAIGPGQGGIEHLNNTTISFDGNSLEKPGSMERIMTFIAHEYFHHFNVKRIRPFELGPFDYDRENRTNLLWISEGLSVYYEYLIVKRAGLADKNALISFLEKNINTVENDAGRKHQSLAQSSYYTWEDGPFGNPGSTEDRTISYYDKGPVVGLLLDFAIRNATENRKSLDDVMRLVYNQYYKKLNRGFTDAEFQQVCETVAGAELTELFEYVYTTTELKYEKYLGFAGLKLEKQNNAEAGKPERVNCKISAYENPNPLQNTIFKSWLGE